MDFSGVMAIVFEIPLFFGPPCMYLFVSENDDTGGHHGVGKQGADWHEVHQHVQVKYGTDQGYKQQF